MKYVILILLMPLTFISCKEQKREVDVEPVCRIDSIYKPKPFLNSRDQTLYFQYYDSKVRVTPKVKFFNFIDTYRSKEKIDSCTFFQLSDSTVFNFYYTEDRLDSILLYSQKAPYKIVY